MRQKTDCRRATLWMALMLMSITAATASAEVLQEVRLQQQAPITSDIFGYGLAFDGRTMLAGAPFGTHSGHQLPGRAFTFERIDGVWRQTQRLLPSTLQDFAFFGTKVAVDGDIAALSATGENAPIENQGAVYVFERGAQGWTEVRKLTASDPVPNGNFGVSLALEGETLFVGGNGASEDELLFAGAVYIFERDGGAWSQIGRLTASDAAQGDLFGTQVAVSGSTLVATAMHADHGGLQNPGAAYVFERIDGEWMETVKLIASDPGNQSKFGQAAAIDGDTIVIGAEEHTHEAGDLAGAAYIFERTEDGWEQTARLIAPDASASARFGCDVAVEGATILIGSFLDAHETGTGSAYLYRRIDGSWEFQQKIVAGDPGNLTFGWTVALSGDRAAISGPFYQTNRGAVYLYRGLRACIEDINGDGVVDMADLAIVLQNFGTQSGARLQDGDVDDDGDVDLADLSAVLSALGASCP